MQYKSALVCIPPVVYIADTPLYAAGLHRPGGGIGRRSGLVGVPHGETRG